MHFPVGRHLPFPVVPDSTPFCTLPAPHVSSFSRPLASALATGNEQQTFQLSFPPLQNKATIKFGHYFCLFSCWSIKFRRNQRRMASSYQGFRELRNELHWYVIKNWFILLYYFKEKLKQLNWTKEHTLKMYLTILGTPFQSVDICEQVP